ncbi:MAG: hypothetical protein ACMVO3_21395 [Thalassobaculum sp.]
MTSTLSDVMQLFLQKCPTYIEIMTASTDSDFEKAFDQFLEKAISGMEMNSSNFESLNEVGLTGVLSLALTMPGIVVHQESHSNGHVDITIEADCFAASRRKLGEAKIYNGPAYHISGLSQLLGRYTTGREGRGLLVSYVRKNNVKGLIEKVRSEMDEILPSDQQGKTKDHKMKWSFITTHQHSSGELLDVAHIGCNLFNVATEIVEAEGAGNG